LTLLVL